MTARGLSAFGRFISHVQQWMLAGMLIIAMCPGRDARTGKGALEYIEQKLSITMFKQYPDYFYRSVSNLSLYTPDAFARRKNIFGSLLREAGAIERSLLTADESVRLSLLVNVLQVYVEGYKWRDYSNLTPLNFIRDNLRLHFSSYYTAESLKDIPIQIDAKIAMMSRAISLGRTLHNASLAGVVAIIEEYERQASPNVTARVNASGMTRALYSDLMEKARMSITRLKIFMKTKYLPNTRPVAGVHYWPNGLEYYKACLRWHLGLNMTPTEVHDTGLQEVTRIKVHLRQLIKKLGFSGDIKPFQNRIKNIPKFFNHTRDYLLKKYSYIINGVITSRLPDFFYKIPLPKVTVIPNMPSGLEAGYSHNIFFVNLDNPRQYRTYNMLPLALHETIPGHHYQTQYAKHFNKVKYRDVLKAFPFYTVPMSFPSFTSYSEGWALYAEYLGDEMGLLDNPYDRYGRYSYELFRACRLVVDTGIHAFRWSRERAIRYIMANVDFDRKKIEVEIDRYITWPGQAVSYKIGELHIKNLRKKAETELGSKFNLRAFHDTVLRVGPIPLSLLDEVVEAWIERGHSSVQAIDTYLVFIVTFMYCSNIVSV